MSPAAKKFVSPSRPNAVDLDRAALVLELLGQPGERGMLADGDDDVVGRELVGRRLSVDGDRRRVDGAAESRRVQLQRLDLPVAEHRGARAAVEQLDAFLQHVVQIFGHARHVLRCCPRP